MSNPFNQGSPGQQPYPQQGPGGQQPYPQQPYPQQGPPPGQQPYPQPGGVPPQAGFGAPPPPPQQPRRKPWKKILRIVVPVIVVIAAIAGYFGTKSSASNAKVGDCITSGDKPKIVNCDKDNAAFTVVEKISGTTDTDRCDSDELQAKGSVASVYWKGSKKKLLCVGVTPHTTLDDIHEFPGASAVTQDMLDELKQKAPK